MTSTSPARLPTMPGRRLPGGMFTKPRPAGCLRAALLAAMLAAPAAAEPIPADFAEFQAEISPAVAARIGGTPRHWRQIEPSLFHLCRDHAQAFATLSAE